MTNKSGVLLALCVFVVFLVKTQVFAQNQSQTIAWDFKLKMEIVVNEAKIRLTNTSSQDVMINYTDHFFVVKEGSTYRILENKLTNSGSKNQEIEIIGKSIPIEVHSLSGELVSNKWGSDLFVHLQKGHLISNNDSNQIQIHMQKGEFKIQNHIGKITLDNLQSKGEIKKQKGDMDIRNFNGEVEIDNSNGYLSLNSNQGIIKVKNSEGSLNFDSQKGQLITNLFNGRIEGTNNEGLVSINLAEDQDVHFKTKSGKITVQIKPESGAGLNLNATEGEIYIPSYLKISRDGSNKFFRGRLKGEIQKGSVYLRATEGTLIVK